VLISVVSQTLPHLKRGAIRDFLDYLITTGQYDDNAWSRGALTYTIGNSTIEFFSVDQPDKVYGAARDILFCNEVNSINEEAFRQLAIRTRDKIFVDYNPTHEFYIHTDYKNRENAKYIHSTFKKNPYLSKEIITELIEAGKRNANFQKVFVEGEIGTIEGTVFNNWDIGDFDTSLQYAFGQDYGFSNDPTTLVKIAINKDKKRIYLKECFYLKGLSTDQIFELNRTHAADSLIIGDSAEPRLIDELRKKGNNIKPAEKGQGSVSAGLLALQDYDLIVTPDSVNLQRELRNYVWLDRGSKLVIDDFNHCFIGETKINTLNGYTKIQDIEKGMYVLTSSGYSKVLKKWNNGIKKVKQYHIDVMGYDNNLYLCCTDDHKLKINGKWKQVSDLKEKDSIYLHRSLTVNGITSIKAKDIIQKVQKDFMLQFGNSQTANYQKGIMFITLMETLTIILLSILQLWIHVYTRVCMLRSIISITKKRLLKTLINSDLLQNNGMQAKREDCGIVNKQKILVSVYSIMANIIVRYAIRSLLKKQHSKDFAVINASLNTEEIQGLIMKKDYVNIAEVYLKLINMINLNFVQKVVVKKITKEEKNSEQVYDLTVENNHEFFANGILVHNCIDATRYIFSFLNKEVKICYC
jgi:phage terminase large subunit